MIPISAKLFCKDEHRTSNDEIALLRRFRKIGRIPYSKFDVGRSMFDVFLSKPSTVHPAQKQLEDYEYDSFNRPFILFIDVGNEFS
jgi:hypothetical protein